MYEITNEGLIVGGYEGLMTSTPRGSKDGRAEAEPAGAPTVLYNEELPWSLPY